ncbi:MAG: D-lactate dehydrogenase (acceptor: cytochrome) [Proteobacteria bacterium]|nr:D-lactate dehydrogenase (acceptor: cytochrome) [Pseudomonadota bacterium]
MNPPWPRHRPLPPPLLETLAARFGDGLAVGEAVRAHHGRDESSHPPALPDAVVFPHSTEEVAEIVGLCRAHGTPVIAFGAGSSVEGQVLATRGGVCIDLTRMNRIVEVHAEDLDACVEAGVTRKQLNEALKGTGLFFPIDPGADATLGGMAATRASGTNAVRYGTMRENVLAATVVLADGRIIHTGTRARKSSAGYDLTRLFIGSEGTLGIITELTVRLYPLPEAISSAVCAFPGVDQAVAAVIQTIQLGVPVARIEILDTLTVRAVNRYSRMSLREAPTLFFEFHGSPDSVEEQARTVQDIAAAHGGMDFEWATRPEDRSRLWQARHDAYFACLALRPGSRSVTTDVCVPISRLAQCIRATQEDVAASGLTAPLLGHVGDGNFHLAVLADPDNAQEMAAAQALNEKVVMRALQMEGTCSGEHGVGLGKQKYLAAEHGEALEVMRALKQCLDPDDLLNPGKVLPPR